MDGPRVHICNVSLTRVRQYVEAGVQRLRKSDGIHLCDQLEISPRITRPLHAAVARVAVGAKLSAIAQSKTLRARLSTIMAAGATLISVGALTLRWVR